jgi:hypothetical protein
LKISNGRREQNRTQEKALDLLQAWHPRTVRTNKASILMPVAISAPLCPLPYRSSMRCRGWMTQNNFFLSSRSLPSWPVWRSSIQLILPCSYKKCLFVDGGLGARATGLDIDPKRVKIGADGLPDVGLFFDSDCASCPPPRNFLSLYMHAFHLLGWIIGPARSL